MGSIHRLAGLLSLTVAVAVVGCTAMPTIGGQSLTQAVQTAADLSTADPSSTDLPSDVSSQLNSDLGSDQTAAMGSIVSDSISSLTANDAINVSGALADDFGTTVQALRAFEVRATPSTQPSPTPNPSPRPSASPSARPSQSPSPSASPSASPQKPSLGDVQKKRGDELRKKARKDLEKKKGAAQHVDHKVVDNGDGTKNHKVVMQVPDKKGRTQEHSVEKKLAADGSVLESHVTIKTPGKNGQSIVHKQHKVFNQDGSASVTHTSKVTRKDGKVKTITHQRTQNADGSESGTGTITGYDGTVVTITFTKDATGVVVQTARHEKAKIVVEITKAEHEDTATVKVTNLKTGKVSTTTIAHCGDLEPSDR